MVVRQVRKLPKEGLQPLNPPPGSTPTNTCNTLYRSEASLLFNRCRLVSWFNKDTGLSTWKKSNKFNQTLRSLTINKEEACNRYSFTHIDFLSFSQPNNHYPQCYFRSRGNCFDTYCSCCIYLSTRHLSSIFRPIINKLYVFSSFLTKRFYKFLPRLFCFIQFCYCRFLFEQFTNTKSFQFLHFQQNFARKSLSDFINSCNKIIKKTPDLMTCSV